MRLMRCLAIMKLNCQIDLTTDSSEIKNNEGEVKASSAVMEANNLEPHMFRKREGGNGHAKILLLRKELSLSKREGFERETCLSWKQQVGKS